MMRQTVCHQGNANQDDKDIPLYTYNLFCTQPHLTLCDSMDCSPPDSSVHKIFQARMLEWVSIFLSRESSWCRGQARVSCVSFTGRQILYYWATQSQNPKHENTRCWWECGATKTHSLMVGIRNGIATSENRLTVSYEIKYALTT